MGMAASGGGMSGVPTGYSVCTSGANSAEHYFERLRASRKKNQRPKKKLKYNPREIANQLQRMSKSRNAAVVLTRAKSKVAVLQAAKASGQYKDSDIRVAMAHARRMVECSRMKVRNLKEEELIKSRDNRDHTVKEQKKRAEVKRRVHQKEQDIKLKMAIEENQQILKEKMRRQVLSQKRRMHRSEEQGKITEADMKYLQRMGEGDQPAYSIDLGSVALELSFAAEQLAQLQRIEMQMEQQVEVQVEMEMSGMEASGMGATSAEAGQALPGASSAGAAGVQGASVDVSV